MKIALIASLLLTGCASSSLGKGLNVGVGVAAVADLHSTRVALESGCCREWNPIMGEDIWRQVILKVAGVSGVIALAELMELKGGTTLAQVMRGIAIGVWSAAAIHNYRFTRN